jgi:3-deoxy-D-manno-octulosonic-acid transferase
MALSLGRRLYNLTSRREPGPDLPWPSRPVGPLVWLLAPRREVAMGLLELARRLQVGGGVSVIFSGMGNNDAQNPLAPADQPADVKAFFDHWRPDLLLMAEGEIRPALMFEAEARGLPVIMVDGRDPVLLRGREGWFPGLLRGAVQTLRQVYALDDAAARAYRKAGAIAVEVSGRMEEASAALPCHEGERSALAETLNTRPVWLAADVPEAEEAAVIAAHRSALRMSHRLLLILVPENPARAAGLAQEIEAAEGWMVASRAEDQEPEPETAVYLPDSAQEYGLWYRLAPVTFLGGSLAGAGALRNPMEPAALGSAILYGPRPGAFGAAFGRLGAARAARAVSSAQDLAEALGDLLAPDRAARLAQSAWAVASDGAEVTDKVLDRVLELLAVRA